MAQQTTDPFFIDVDIATSLDFQIHMSDYVDILTEFADEMAVNINYIHTKSHSDPVTSKINFYKDINSGSLKVKDNPDGTVKRESKSDDLMNKNYRDQLPEELIIKTETGNRYSKPILKSDTAIEATVTTTTRTWSGDSDIQSNGEWIVETTTKNTEHPVVPVLPIQKEPPTLKGTYGLKDMSSWFKMWWIEKFITSHEVVKRDLIELLGEENEYFVKFSESVGQLKNLSDTFDTSTLPMWDTNVDALGPEYSVPSTIAGVAKYCVKKETLYFDEQLSKHTNKVFRNNMCNMMEDASRDELTTGVMPSFSPSSHGNNFVNDQEHYSRIYQMIDVIDAGIRDHLKGLYDVLMLLSSRLNHMKVNKPKQVMLKVEKFTLSVDLFKNRIKSCALTQNDCTFGRYGGSVTYNTNKTNEAVLVAPKD